MAPRIHIVQKYQLISYTISLFISVSVARQGNPGSTSRPKGGNPQIGRLDASYFPSERETLPFSIIFSFIYQRNS